MPRQKKDYKSLNVNLESSIADMLDTYIQITGLSKTAAVERILSAYLEAWNRERKEGKKNIL